MAVQAAEPDVEVIVLPEAPAVALEIAREVKLGRVGRDREFCSIQRVDRELDFLGGNDRCVAKRAIEPAGYRAKVTAGADEHCARTIVA